MQFGYSCEETRQHSGGCLVLVQKKSYDLSLHSVGDDGQVTSDSPINGSLISGTSRTLMFDKNTEQSVQFHSVPTGTSDVVAFPEYGSIVECAQHAMSEVTVGYCVLRYLADEMKDKLNAPLDYSHSRSKSKCTNGECMSSAPKHQRIKGARSDRSVVLYIVSCSRDVHEREDVSMCPYTHVQGLQEVTVRDSLRPTIDLREVAVAP